MLSPARFRSECFIATATRPGYARVELEHAPTGRALTLHDYAGGATLPELEALALDELRRLIDKTNERG